MLSLMNIVEMAINRVVLPNPGFLGLFRLSQEPRLAQRYLLRDPKFLSIFFPTGLLPRPQR
jgi:hypothetical protein